MDPQSIPTSHLIHALLGGKIRIEAVVLDDGSCPANEFIDQLGDVNTAKVKALFDLFLCRYPRNLSDQKFKKIEDSDLFEFKCFQIRIPCFFFPDGRILLTHGVKKKADNLRPRDITKAQAIKATFERRVKSHG